MELTSTTLARHSKAAPAALCPGCSFTDTRPSKHPQLGYKCEIGCKPFNSFPPSQRHGVDFVLICFMVSGSIPPSAAVRNVAVVCFRWSTTGAATNTSDVIPSSCQWGNRSSKHQNEETECSKGEQGPLTAWSWFCLCECTDDSDMYTMTHK